MKLLFICSQNLHRSPTAEEVFRGRFETRSAGLYNEAPVTAEQLEWAGRMARKLYAERGRLPAPAHLWFLYYLMIFYLLMPLCLGATRLLERSPRAATRAAGRRPDHRARPGCSTSGPRATRPRIEASSSRPCCRA